MYVEDAVNRIIDAGRDASKEFTIDRCIEWINNVTQQVTALLISNRFPSITKTIDLKNGDSLPANYMKSAGTYPIRITDGHVELLDNLKTVRFRYFASPANVVKTSDKMPYEHDAINEIIVRGAIVLALNENRANISQDAQLLTALQEAIAGGMIQQ